MALSPSLPSVHSLGISRPSLPSDTSADILHHEFTPVTPGGMREMASIYLDGEATVLPRFWSDPFCIKDFKRLGIFLPRLLFALVFFSCGIYCNSVSNAWLQSRMAGYYEKNWAPVLPQKQNVTLWDVSFTYLPYVNDTKPADLFAKGAPPVIVFRFMILPGPLSLRWTIMCRFLVIWGLLWFFRGFTIIVTPLPNPDHTCVPIIRHPGNIFLEAWAIIARGDNTCQDVLYSGHTVALTLTGLFLIHYGPRSPWCPGAWNTWRAIGALNIIVFMIFLGYYFIIATHFHYTVDVMMGAMITFLTFKGYHHVVRLAFLRDDSRWSHYSLLIWFERHAKDMKVWKQRAIRYLEVESTGQLLATSGEH